MRDRFVKDDCIIEVGVYERLNIKPHPLKEAKPLYYLAWGETGNRPITVRSFPDYSMRWRVSGEGNRGMISNAPWCFV